MKSFVNISSIKTCLKYLQVILRGERGRGIHEIMGLTH